MHKHFLIDLFSSFLTRKALGGITLWELAVKKEELEKQYGYF